MIKVLIIDDEPLQRQGIVRMTPWTDFDAEVVGDTGSGMEGILLARRLLGLWRVRVCAAGDRARRLRLSAQTA